MVLNGKSNDIIKSPRGRTYGNYSRCSSTDGERITYKSPVILIGSIPLGGDHPIRIQSMTNTNTLDTKASVAQCIRIIEAGADFVRLTAQGTKEAENLEKIRKELHTSGFDTPLIADIHFNPPAAETAARIVEKVRINPGNYADKRASFIKTELTDKQYNEELKKIHSRLLPLIKICHANNTAIRIGVNHGSLSDRIMSRYGNTPEGMAISAFEFIKIFLSENFTRLVLSLKSSDLGVMLQANRMFVSMMQHEQISFPVHLGVTEAGGGEDGRIRSAAGIGALLSEGIGDTIRVSLTEAPENEIPVAKEIINFLGAGSGRVTTPSERQDLRIRERPYRPEVFTFEQGSFIDESDQSYHGKIITFTPDNPPSLSYEPEEKYILNPVFSEDDPDKLSIDAAALLGRYFILKQADGICITNTGKVRGRELKKLAFSILQETEARITRNRYISCPTCGRTKFDLQEAVRRVKIATGHLTGLKIAIMGCIVNGPGEMAGADYGYVGTATGKVNIYRGQVPVLKNISHESASDLLLKIIEEDLKKKETSF